LFDEVGLLTAPHETVAALDELHAALARVGTPAMLKSRRFGYDGKSQAVIHDALLAEDAWRAIGEVPSIVEGFVEFERELSILGARGLDGSTAFYPLVENHHREGILRRSVAPAPGLTAELQAVAELHARAVMDRLEYVGVLAIELFQVREELFGNELAPRVHNSGHWTIEGADTSQFENHLRAITGLPLGSTASRGVSVMLNLIGEVPDPSAIAAIPGVHLHLYGKEPRPRRKLGHVTVTGNDPAALPLGELAGVGLDGS
jgi:5-(carboxyamino)imidazole ribonucleotide synthase